MTKAQFITAVEAKPQFLKWATVPVAVETLGDIEKWHGVAYITTDDGTNTYNVWFMLDTVTGVATWQEHDTMSPELNKNQKKMDSLQAYLAGKYQAYFIGRVDLINNWGEADVFTLTSGNLVKKAVLVYQKGTDPIADIDVI